MILRTVCRASCVAARSSPRSPPWRAQQDIANRVCIRIFTSTNRARRDDLRQQSRIHTELQRQPSRPAEESVEKTPETARKTQPAEPATARKDPLALEQKTNQEQRKADWAIMKEMVKYLWPKDNYGTKIRVGVEVALLVG